MSGFSSDVASLAISTGWEPAEVLEILLSSGTQSEQYHTRGGSTGDSPYPNWAWAFVWVHLAHPNRLTSKNQAFSTPASTGLCPQWTLSINGQGADGPQEAPLGQRLPLLL